MPVRPHAAPPPTSVIVPTKQMAVYEALRAEILNGALKPGEAMVIDALAKRFQVSIIPVREALRQLQAERLVEITPHTGVRVTMVDAASLGEIFAMLGALEGISAVQCLPHLVEGDVLQLEALLKKLESTAQKGDRAGFEEANREFHLLPCRIAGFTRVEQTLQSLLTEWERLHRSAFPLAQPPDMVAANRDHRDIVDALKSKDAAKLGPLLAQHNQTAVEHYQRFAEMLK
jgi:DNA-binding GntR family transcriptional regulator